MAIPDYKSLQMNESLLDHATDGLSRDELGIIGMAALDTLAKILPADQFKEFLTSGLEHAKGLVEHLRQNAPDVLHQSSMAGGGGGEGEADESEENPPNPQGGAPSNQQVM